MGAGEQHGAAEPMRGPSHRGVGELGAVVVADQGDRLGRGQGVDHGEQVRHEVVEAERAVHR